MMVSVVDVTSDWTESMLPSSEEASSPLSPSPKNNLNPGYSEMQGQLWSLTQFYSDDFSKCKKVCFQQMHNQGLRQLLLTVS